MLNVNENYARVLAHRLEKRSWFNKIKKGVYQLIPSSYGLSWDVPIPSDPYLLASKLARPYCISHFSAAFLHGLTDQIPSTVFISTPIRYHQKLEKQYKFKFIYMPLRLLKFGCAKMNYRGVNLVVSDIYKTIIDIVDKPHCAGGLAIVCEIIRRARDRVMLNKLAEYALRTRKKVLIQRLGYLTELASYRWDTRAIARLKGKI